MALDHFYDGQLRRYLLQFIRIFNGFQYQAGVSGANNTPVFRTVPTKMALRDQMIAAILRNNSENTVLTVPQMTCAIAGWTIPAERRQIPNFVSSVNVSEREFDEVTQKYGTALGKTYTVHRYMAIPYDLTMQVDLWTSNERQKHEILEQILVLFNPSIDIQTGTNPVDWSALTIVELTDVNWSNRGIQIGGQTSELEISTLTFKMPIWLNPPAKVQRQRLIHQIITNIGELGKLETKDGCGDDNDLLWGENDFLSRSIVTPNNHMISIDGQEVTLLGPHGSTVDDDGNLWSWRDLFEMYQQPQGNDNILSLKTNPNMDDHLTDIRGQFEFHQTEPNKLWLTIDIATLPANTLSDINGIVDPMKTVPGNGLPEAATGQRYLFLEGIAGGFASWGQLNAEPGDIVQYTGTEWVVSFRPSDYNSIQYVLNALSGKQLKWDGEDWVLAIEGRYAPGFWRLLLPRTITNP